MTIALGIDLGGTKILAGVIDVTSGSILSSAIRSTKSAAGENVVERIEAVALEAVKLSGCATSELIAAGIGVAGQVDVETGTILRTPNLPPSLVGLSLSARLRPILGCPVAVVNDVVAAGAGEAGFGSGKGCSNFICIFVGTGIGGAIVENGRVRLGATNTAGELGHMVIDAGGRTCGCGARGHLEAYASHSAVMRTLLGALRLGRPSLLSALAPNPDPDERAHGAIRYSDLAAAIKAGDSLAIEMVQDGARYLGIGLASIINFYNPPRMVLGGGMVEELDLFFETSAERARAECLQVPRQSVEVVRASLGANSGIVGAALIASQDIRGSQ